MTVLSVLDAGKTIAAICSFLLWSTYEFDNGTFAIVGKSVGAVSRNVIEPMKQILNAWGWQYNHNISNGEITIGNNIYYIFGAPNEASKETLQGLTLCGSLVDEVALIPEEYFNQLNGRHISIPNHKIFCTCNPAGPMHWFKKKWIDRRKSMNTLYLHFMMSDNLSLPPNAEEDARKKFTGVFAKRYILGLWVLAEGLVYPMFEDKHIVDTLPDKFVEYHVGVDVGDNHPTTFMLVGKTQTGDIYLLKEYKQNGKVYSAYSQDFKEFVKGYNIKSIVVDSAAASFIRQLRSDGFPQTRTANKAVTEGISEISNLLSNNKLFIYKDCKETIKEFYSYSWNSKSAEIGKDEVIKLNDDCLDSLRYVIMTSLILKQSKVRTLSNFRI